MGEQKLGECNDVTSDRKKGVAGLCGYVGSEGERSCGKVKGVGAWATKG